MSEGDCAVIKKLMSVILALLFTALCPVFSASAGESFNLEILENCGKLYSYSGTGSAYFYGFRDKTLYSSRVIPSQISRYITVSGTIRAVCHDENCAYALYDGSGYSFGIVRMNMNSGNCDYLTIPDTKNASNRSFAASGNEVFIIFGNSSYSNVCSFNFSGQKLYSYNFSQGVELLFNNCGYAYAKARSGDIFRLSGGSKTFCANLDAYSNFENAGAGYILSGDNQLISLNGSGVDYPNCSKAVRTVNNTFKINGSSLSFSGGETDIGSAKLMCAAGNKAAVLQDNYNCVVIDSAEYKSNSSNGSTRTIGNLKLTDNIILGIEPEITVTKVKEKFPEIIKLYDTNRSEITSGKLRTGCWAEIPGGTYELALTGDTNGSGTVNSADTDDIMSVIIGEKNLNGCYQKAADYNLDGVVDTKDLVLIGKMAKSD